MRKVKPSPGNGTNLLRRFSVRCASALVVLAVILGLMITRIYESTALEGEKGGLAEYILADARENIRESDLEFAKSGPDYEIFRQKLSRITGLPHVLGTAVCSADGIVVWSDDRTRVGRAHPDPDGIRRALRGTVHASFTERTPGEAGPPRASRDTMAIYVPLKFDGSSRVAGVVRIDKDIAALRASIRSARAMAWGVLAAGFGILYLLLAGVVRYGNRLIDRGRRELKISQEKNQSQRMELLNRIGASALRESNIDNVLTEAARDACRLLELRRCRIRLTGDEEKVYEQAGEGDWGKPSTDLADGEDRAAGSGETRFAPDGSAIHVPLRIHKSLGGILSLDRGEAHAWTDDEVVTAEAASRQIAYAVRHVRLFNTQQELAGRLLSLMNNLPGIVYRGLPDWTLPVVGADIERIVGHTAENFTRDGIRWDGIVLPEDLDSVKRRLRGAVKSGEKVLRLEYRVRHKDGSVRWVSDRRQMIYDADGRLAYVDGLALDITERKRSEEVLRLTQFSVDRAGDAAYWMGPDARLLYVNEKACRILGYTREELLSMTIRDINPDYPSGAWEEHWDELRRRKSFTVESSHRAKDGTLIPVEITVNYIEFDGKEYNCASARDITERKRAQDESRLLTDQLLQAQKMEAVGILAGGIAHDFNNLLTGILGYADLLRESSDPGGEVWKAADVIQGAAERASRLTSQLLGFARKGKNLSVPVDIGKTISDVLSILERTSDRRIRIVKAYREGAVTVAGDPSQLEGVIMNLAMNARDAMPGGGDLTVSTENVTLDDAHCRSHPGATPGRYAMIAVTDTGVGIPAENLEKVFDPFFTTKEQGKGSGLGLSMVFGIVKNHGGHLAVDSRIGVGTTFRVYLPFAAGAELPPEAPPQAADEPVRGQGTILVVDDQEAVREVCGAMLRALGYRVVTATDGREGVDYYRRFGDRIDLVIVDMVMPNLGGRDCFRRMRELNPQVRAVLSTGYSLEGQVQETLNEGMLGFIQKPYRIDQLSRVVASAMDAVV